MSTLSKTQSDFMNHLYKEYGLTPDHIHTHKHYKIITRPGIEKIMAKAKITAKYEMIECSKDFACVKVTGSIGASGNTMETFGSASPANSTNAYYPEMAEKRAKSRITLMLIGAYEEGFFGEDESEDFASQSSNAPVKPYTKDAAK